jgi:hypothetical protein
MIPTFDLITGSPSRLRDGSSRSDFLRAGSCSWREAPVGLNEQKKKPKPDKVPPPDPLGVFDLKVAPPQLDAFDRHFTRRSCTCPN